MKHIFIINPVAGKTDSTDIIKKGALGVLPKEDCEFYLTKAMGDGADYAKKYVAGHPGEDIRFYACGGDGTINEICNAAVGMDNVQIVAYPCGSGNDFVKYYGGKDCFTDFASLVNGTPHKIDAIRVSDRNGVRYCVNVDNFGFDACVCDVMNGLKGHPVFGGSAGYLVGVAKSFVSSMKTTVQIKVDGEILNEVSEILLATMSNCHYVGGMFFVAPKAKNDDGLIDVCAIKCLTRPQFVKLLVPYMKGELFTNKIFDSCRLYKQGRKVEIAAPEGFINCIDGEIIRQNRFTAEIVPGAVNFVVPLDATLNNPKT